MWPDKTTPRGAKYASRRSAILGRAQSELLRIRDLAPTTSDQRFIVVVSHSGFLRAGVTGSWFFNADYRVFDFAHPDVPAAAPQPVRLVQWESTREGGGGLGLSFKHEVEIGSGLVEEDGPENSPALEEVPPATEVANGTAGK